MRAILDHFTGGQEILLAAGKQLIRQGESSGHLYVLVDGRLDIIKGDTVVATVAEPGAILGEMSVLLKQSHTATVRAAVDTEIYQINDAVRFLREQPEVALLVATQLAQRLNAATTYLADIKRQYAGHGTHLAMVGDVLESLVNVSRAKAEPGSDRQPDPRL